MTVKDLRCCAVVKNCSFPAACFSSARIAVFPICLAVLILMSLPGCDHAPKGLKRFPISGTVLREGTEIDEGGIKFVPTADGPAASGRILNGEYKFTDLDGVPAGKYQVIITAIPYRDPKFKGMGNGAPILPDDRFKKAMPDGGWKKEANITGDPKQTIDFDVD